MKNLPYVEERDAGLFKKCPRCGARVAKESPNETCHICTKRIEGKNPCDGPGRGRKIVYAGGYATCKMPRCKKRFLLRVYQDKRFTVYCPDCRKKIAVITDGVQWLSRLGIEFVVGDDGEEEIIQDSLVKAYDEDTPKEAHHEEKF